jgi:hypothetical protein
MPSLEFAGASRKCDGVLLEKKHNIPIYVFKGLEKERVEVLLFE